MGKTTVGRINDMMAPEGSATVNATAKIPLVYILAASHSGSTLLAMLLGAHRDTCTVGELKASSLGDTERYRCSCLARIKECSFWSDITTAMAARGFAFDVTNAGTDIRNSADAYQRRLLKPLHRGPVLEAVRDVALGLSPRWRARLAHVQALNAALMESVLARTGKRVIVDSSKIGLRLKYLLRNPRLDVRVLRLVRDGRAVALTYVKPRDFADARDPTLRGGGSGKAVTNRGLSVAEGAMRWRRSNEEADALVRRLDPARWIEVRYETLCADPDATLQRIFSFMGIDPERRLPNFRAVEHHVIGNGMRMDSMSEIRLDERWRSVFTAGDLATFDAVAGETNRRFGYR